MRVSLKRSAWARRSEDVSTRIVAPLASRTRIDGRERLSRGSVDRQTAQAQPIIGTPIDVPVPRNVTSTGLGGRNWLDGPGAVVSALRQGMMMRDFSGAAAPSLDASMYF